MTGGKFCYIAIDCYISPFIIYFASVVTFVDCLKHRPSLESFRDLLGWLVFRKL